MCLCALEVDVRRLGDALRLLARRRDEHGARDGHLLLSFLHRRVVALALAVQCGVRCAFEERTAAHAAQAARMVKMRVERHTWVVKLDVLRAVRALHRLGDGEVGERSRWRVELHGKLRLALERPLCIKIFKLGKVHKEQLCCSDCIEQLKEKRPLEVIKEMVSNAIC